MPKRKDSDSGISDVLADILAGVDFRIETDEFVVYAISRLIDEDRASFEDEEFRRVIDAAIGEHVGNRPEIRAEMALRLRRAMPSLDASARRIALRSLHALEDIHFPVQNVSVVVRAFTAYLFRRLEQIDAEDHTALETEARSLIEQWQQGQILREQMIARLKAIGRPAVGPLADLLFDAPDDHNSAMTAVSALASIPCPSSARVLVHAIMEPILPEDVELEACRRARMLWPLPRPYVFFLLASHSHEDLPFRWFQLLIECDAPEAVEIVLEEVLEHGGDPAFREDLLALIPLLSQSRDPETELKVMALLNSEEMPPEMVKSLESAAVPDALSGQTHEIWAQHARRSELNRRYLEAARLTDAGRREEGLQMIERILDDDPGYPFAVALKELLSR